MYSLKKLSLLIDQAIAHAQEKGLLPQGEFAPSLEKPRDASHGDWASTIALRITKIAKKPPREIAQIIIDELPENEIIAHAEIAGPGFINFSLTPAVYQAVVNDVRKLQADYGKSSLETTRCKVNLEYISANPTGPLHVGHGRWAALGDSIARIMRHAGYDVHEEFYVNDHGTQMMIFAQSIRVRYLQQLGVDIKMPDDCYGGSYVIDIAKDIFAEKGDVFIDMPEEESLPFFRDYGYRAMIDNQKQLLKRFGTTFDCWFSESDLYVKQEGKDDVERAMDYMNERGYIYEKDGAVWFESSQFGDSKDRVLIKADGNLTYFASDMAYHYNKIQRGYDLLIDLWGADHHGYIKRCEAMMEAWGYPGKLEVVLGQLVNLMRNDVPVRMSKRTGEMITFEELVDEVGVDATRFLMLSRSSDQPVDFDIEVAKQQDASNPVYYVQYAHARICSIMRRAFDQETSSAKDLATSCIPYDVDLSLLTHESELALMKSIDGFTQLVSHAARDRAPYRLTHFAQDLAGLFHQFYTNCHVASAREDVRMARLALIDATRIVLEITLDLLGVNAPERM